MATRYLPLFLRHSPTPQVEHFALLAGLEAAVRGTLISAMPLVVYEAMGSAEATSAVYFHAGLVALVWGLMVPWFTRFLPRRWMYSAGCALYLVGMSLALTGTQLGVSLAVPVLAMATATTFVCFNAYVLDYIDRASLGRSQSTQMLFSATPWAVGPMLGVWLRSLWAPAPFLLAGAFAIALLIAFWILRMGNGKQISRAKGPAPNPLGYLARFFAQTRLIAGWSFAVIRSCGWWVYVVYLPIYCVEANIGGDWGIADKVGGVALSFSNALLFAAPFMLRFTRRWPLRTALRAAFALCGTGFLLAAIFSPWPWVAVAAMMFASIFLVVLDTIGGLPFLMAVKPSERTEMAAVYSSFRDVSGIATPGIAWAVLLVAPLPGIFAVCGAAMGAAFVTASTLHRRLGLPRPSRGGGRPARA
ncbi:MFS transporter [Neotabrizicola shimadae]|uniref:MFS transporter n=1 Tax=Neotabrizicola shimadae TaxID=2807096 RepID=A0A8G0ZTC7_9RHOB|nr:MFS transporter [Neotabrizicola shimadae]QYZ69692.1 MFS transporter [Neotabrizicola shimadae]